MKHFSFIFFLSLCLSLATLQLSAEDLRLSAVRTADDARIAAMKTPNREELTALFSDELRYAHSTGAVDTKASFIDVLTSGKTKYLGYDIIERDFTFPAPGIALMSGRTRIQAEARGNKMDSVLSFLGVWREEEGQWRFLAWQSCKLPSPQP